MRLNIIIAVIVAMTGYSLTIYLDHLKAPKISSSPDNVNEKIEMIAAPDFDFKTTSNLSKSLHDFRGKAVILNFWASWCTPCVKEFPALLNVAEQFPDEVLLLAVSSDHEEEAMMKFIDRFKAKGHDLTKPNIMITRDINNHITQKLYQTYRLPETLVIDQNMKIRKKLVGANWEEKELSQTLQDLITD